ncbi:hypothetical protein [uncultured Desulfosarcina sp.]|uniref:hypothetical protein n=1 Tax=uncultured Desulfosarcina sp. TaxID=218289 RepID=UPI0029C6E8C4|nr:hypothetical protein [uncultured Desulfosarcina sp.]
MVKHHVSNTAQDLAREHKKDLDANHQELLRTTLNDHPIFEKLQQAALTPEQQTRLFELIAATFKNAIDVRAPKNRPPGKAGLRAEKGYYRLLYLEGNLHDKVNTRDKSNPDAPSYNWDPLIDIMRQLKDIPELRSEILAGVKSALDQITGQTQTRD